VVLLGGTMFIVAAASGVARVRRSLIERARRRES
jgi:hypothetical protein